MPQNKLIKDIGRTPRSNTRTRRAIQRLGNLQLAVDGETVVLDANGELVVQTQGVLDSDANGLLLNYGDGLTDSSGSLVANLGDGLTIVSGAIEPDLATAGGLEFVSGELAVDESNVDHDSLQNFVSNEHIDHSGVDILTDEGIIGGGNLTASRTVQLGINQLPTASPDEANDSFLFYDANNNAHRIATISTIQHDNLAGFVGNEHIDHSGVTITGGVGLTGGGSITASREIDLDFSSLNEATTVDRDNDLIPLYDVSAGEHKWIHPPNPNLGAREQLTAHRTYHVDPTNGSDSNDGRTAMNAFATVQKAIDTAASLDLGVYNITIRLADDTYTERPVFKTLIGAGICKIEGNTGTPSNVLFDANGTVFSGEFRGVYELRGVKIQTSGGVCLEAGGVGGLVRFADIEFGSAPFAHIQVVQTSRMECAGSYTISGDSARHVRMDQNGTYRQAGNMTVTITGTPHFANAFVDCGAVSYAFINSNNVVYSGSATGRRYLVEKNAVLETNGAGANYFPGDAAGVTQTGGQYV